jgi:hypothetical protein
MTFGHIKLTQILDNFGFHDRRAKGEMRPVVTRFAVPVFIDPFLSFLAILAIFMDIIPDALVGEEKRPTINVNIIRDFGVVLVDQTLPDDVVGG